MAVRRYEMSEDQLQRLMEACKPVAMIGLQCGSPASPQENANAAWAKLGDEMGFDPMTVRPAGGGDKFFYAEPRALAEGAGK